MSGKSFLFDSNIIIRLSKQDPEIVDFINDSSLKFISVVTYMEVLGYPFASKAEEDFVKKLVNLFALIHIDQDIADQTVKIRKKQKIKLPDAIIAATAQIHKCKLVTANIKDFKAIKGLQVVEK